MSDAPPPETPETPADLPILVRAITNGTVMVGISPPFVVLELIDSSGGDSVAAEQFPLHWQMAEFIGEQLFKAAQAAKQMSTETPEPPI